MLACRQSQARMVMAGDMLPPVITYLSLGLSSVSYFIATANDVGRITDRAGAIWSVAALAETMLIINIFGLVVIAFIALAKIASNHVGQTNCQTSEHRPKVPASVQKGHAAEG